VPKDIVNINNNDNDNDNNNNKDDRINTDDSF